MANTSVYVAVGGAVVLVATSALAIVLKVHFLSSEQVKLAMQIFISLVVLFAALYVVVIKSNATPAQKHWAFGALGTLVGFWLKG